MASSDKQGYEPPIPGWALAILLYMVIFFSCACYWWYKRRQQQEEERLEAKISKDDNDDLKEDETSPKYNLRKQDNLVNKGPKFRGVGTRKHMAGPPPAATEK